VEEEEIRKERVLDTRRIERKPTMKNKTSFGEYFDDQRDRIVQDMQTGKNAELNIAWREDYDNSQREKKERKYRKELLECSEKGVEISPECKVYFKKQFETSNESVIDK